MECVNEKIKYEKCSSCNVNMINSVIDIKQLWKNKKFAYLDKKIEKFDSLYIKLISMWCKIN